jgi:hypothetical protein
MNKRWVKLFVWIVGPVGKFVKGKVHYLFVFHISHCKLLHKHTHVIICRVTLLKQGVTRHKTLVKKSFFTMISIMTPTRYHMGKKGQVFWKSKCLLKHTFLVFECPSFYRGKFFTWSCAHHMPFRYTINFLLMFYVFMY